MKKYTNQFVVWVVGITIIFSLAILFANKLIETSISNVFEKFTTQFVADSSKLNDINLTELHQNVFSELHGDLYSKIIIILFAILLIIIVLSVRFYLLNKNYKIINLHEAILRSTKNAMFATDTDRNITFINPKALALLGKTADEVLGKKCASVFNVELCNSERCAIECYKHGRESCSFVLGDKTLFTEAFGLKNEHGNDAGYIEVIIDQTEEVQLKKEMAAKASWYETILNYIPQPVSVTDMDKNITFLNQMALDILGTTAEQTMGKHCGSIWNVPICKDDRCGIEYLKCGKGISTFEIGGRTMTTDARYITDEKGNNIGHLEIVGDITDVIARRNYNNNAVEKLAAGIEKMAKGDLTNIDFTMEPGGPHTQIAAKAFTELGEHLYNLKDNLVSLISQLQQAINTTASASAEISHSAEALATATQEQASQTDDVASAMEEMSKTVTDNARSATKTAEVAKHTEEIAHLGGGVVNQTINKMKEIAIVVKMSADNISKLGESSKKIGEIIGVIDDIADQTNLLSLNAAIEAARAGEQGRGFAVVADSVGKLAVSTATATKEIAGMIKGIQIDTDAAVKAMEKGTLEVQSGIELADNAGHSIQDILTTTSELLDMVNQIAAANEEQSATSEQISKSINSISKVTAESARNVESVADTTTELTRMAETLDSLASQFKIESDNTGHYLNRNNDHRLN